jgi:short-subunit dehydrogenase
MPRARSRANHRLVRPEALDQIVTATGSGEIGLYVSNAGTDYFGKPFLDSPLAGWLDMIAVNTSTMVQAARHFGGLMRTRGRGGLLMVNSGACYMGGGRLAIYTACKGFQLNFCQSLGTELRPHGVDVLSLVLGKTDTPNYDALQVKNGHAKQHRPCLARYGGRAGPDLPGARPGAACRAG